MVGVSRKTPLGILISGRGSNMQALAGACSAPEYPAKVALVFSNDHGAPGLAWARETGIRTASLAHRDYASREEFDEAMDQVLRNAGVEFIACAGYMRILSSGFTGRWRGRLINIHPSLLPLYKGLNTHARALADGATEHGCSVHYVSEELDGGEIIARAKVAVRNGDTPDVLARRVLEAEHRLYPQALKTALQRL